MSGAAVAGQQGARNPLLLAGWLEFAQVRHGVTPVWLRRGSVVAEGPVVEAVLYVNRRGQVVRPPLHPYVGLSFQSTNTQAKQRVTRQWLELGEELAQEVVARGLEERLLLPPEVTDVRPWQWVGYRTEVRYTYRVELPYDLRQADGMVRNRIKRAAAAGYRCERTQAFRDVHQCLLGSEARQGFRHLLSPRDLELLTDLVGEEHVRVYVCYGPDGVPASGQVVLHHPGATAIGWVAGTTREALRSGANQLLVAHMLADITAAGATSFDYVGANLPGVAAAKADWGASLIPTYTVEPYGMKSFGRWMRDWWRQRRPRVREEETL